MGQKKTDIEIAATYIIDLHYNNCRTSSGVYFGLDNAINASIIHVKHILTLPSIHEGRMVVVLQEDYTFWKNVLKYLEDELKDFL